MVIGQAAAIGDILFIEPICRHIHDTTGVRPILPIRDHLMWLKQHINSADIQPLSKFDPVLFESMKQTESYLPLRFANQVVRGLAAHDHSDYANTMPDKYILAGLPIERWMELNISYNWDKCKELFYKLGLTASEKYVVINNHSQAGSIDIQYSGPHRVVEMKEYAGFSLLDWAHVFLFAQEIHSVSTSTFYMMQSLHNENPWWDVPCYIYPRPNTDGLLGISKLPRTFNCILVQ